MKALPGRAAAVILVTILWTLQRCSSAYQRTYEQQTQRLETQQRAIY